MMATQYRAAKTPLGVRVLIGEKLHLALEVAKTRRFAAEPGDFLLIGAGSVRPAKMPVRLSSAAIASA